MSTKRLANDSESLANECTLDLKGECREGISVVGISMQTTIKVKFSKPYQLQNKKQKT